MPAFALDARDMLIAAAQSTDPVMYIDDRWCYESSEKARPPNDVDIALIGPKIVRTGCDVTVAGAGYSVQIALKSADILKNEHGIKCEVIDIRQLNPIDSSLIIKSTDKTGRFVAVDGGWSNSGFASELISQVAEKLPLEKLSARPVRVTLPDCPAPSAVNLEEKYYLSPNVLADKIKDMFV